MGKYTGYLRKFRSSATVKSDSKIGVDRFSEPVWVQTYILRDHRNALINAVAISHV